MKARALFVVPLLIVLLAACQSAPAPTATRQPTAVPPTATTAPVEATAEAEAAATGEAETPEAGEAETPEASETAEVGDAATAEATAADATPEADVPTAAGGITARINQVNTNARGGPGNAYPAVTPVQVGTEYPVLAQAGSGPGLWYLIELPDGQQGWVWSRVVTLNPEDAEVEAAATIPPTPAP